MASGEWVDIAIEDPPEDGIYEVEIRNAAGTGGVQVVRSEAIWSRAHGVWFDKKGHPETELWMVMHWRRR